MEINKARLVIAIIGILFMGCTQMDSSQGESNSNTQAFSFAFMTDIHLNFSKDESFTGFEQAIEKAKQLGVDFIITGGDNVDADAVGKDEDKAREMFRRFREIIDRSAIDIKVTIGNHDRFWHQPQSQSTHGAAMFLDYFPTTFFSYQYNDVYFMHLNTSEVCDGKYCISETQRTWIKQTLDALDPLTPLVLIVHVPFLSFYYPALYGHYTHKDIFDGFKEVWDLFKSHNLKLVLQGHMHLFEELNVLNTQFITGGALSGKWWGGSYHGTQEGFVLIKWDGNDFQWEYVGFGWDATKYQ